MCVQKYNYHNEHIISLSNIYIQLIMIAASLHACVTGRWKNDQYCQVGSQKNPEIVEKNVHSLLSLMHHPSFKNPYILDKSVDLATLNDVPISGCVCQYIIISISDCCLSMSRLFRTICKLLWIPPTQNLKAKHTLLSTHTHLGMQFYQYILDA